MPTLRQEIHRGVKTRRQKKRQWQVALFIVFVLVHWLALIYLLAQPLWPITQVEVVGNKKLVANELHQLVQKNFFDRDYFFIFPANNYFYLSTRQVAQSLLTHFPNLEKVSVEKNFSGVLRVVVVERQARALWCFISPVTNEDDCYLLDRRGLAYERFISLSGLLPELRGGVIEPSLKQAVISPADLTQVLSLYQQVPKLMTKSLPTEAGWSVNRAEFLPAGDLALILDDGQRHDYRLLLSYRRPVAESLSALQIALTTDDFLEEFKLRHQELSYLDLRFPGKVFYRFRGDE